MTNESGLREKITTLIDDSESDIYWAVEMGRTFDKKPLVDQIIALVSPAGEVGGWQGSGEYSLWNYPDDEEADHNEWSVFWTREGSGTELARGMTRQTAEMLLAALSAPRGMEG